MLTMTFRSKLWLYPSPGGWHFITLPKARAREIKSSIHDARRGWGALPVKAKIGTTTWATSIFPDRKSASYLLPVKAAVRKRENIEDGDTVIMELEVKV